MQEATFHVFGTELHAKNDRSSPLSLKTEGGEIVTLTAPFPFQLSSLYPPNVFIVWFIENNFRHPEDRLPSLSIRPHTGLDHIDIVIKFQGFVDSINVNDV